jgi:hypothetical protein
MNQLEKWNLDGVIDIYMSETAQNETTSGNDQMRTEKTFDYYYSMALANTQDEQRQLRNISSIIFPEGVKNQNQWNDVVIVFTAHKDECILITADGGSKTQPGGILGHKAELKELGIIVMTDKEAVEYIRELISKRDQQAIEMNKLFKEPLPDWINQD